MQLIILLLAQTLTAFSLKSVFHKVVDTVEHPIQNIVQPAVQVIAHPIVNVVQKIEHPIDNVIKPAVQKIEHPIDNIVKPAIHAIAHPIQTIENRLTSPLRSLGPNNDNNDDSFPISDLNLTGGTPVKAGKPVTDPALKAAIRQYAPYFIFHSQEQYFPSSVDTFVANTKLFDKRDPENPKIIPNQPSPLTFQYLATLPKEVHESCYMGTGAWNWWKSFADIVSFRRKIDDLPWLKGAQSQSDQTMQQFPDAQFIKEPVYTIVRERNNFTYVYYWTFYPWNEGKLSFGDHFGDLEFAALKLQKQGDQYQPVALKLSEHDFGHTYDAKDDKIKFLKEDFNQQTGFGHPILFVAKGSHGLNYEPQNVAYAKGLLKDEFDEGHVHWKPWLQMNDENVVEMADDELGTIGQNFMFRGTWGDMKICKTNFDCGKWDLLCKAKKFTANTLCFLEDGPDGLSVRDYVINPDF